ncbi:efflux transporter outer membrane subunit [Kaistella flava (ex Peng et al. 2021)]|uniref:Efflux transporter outer membrane subunit n=1 Tax=Kaistella flava (ex Peng et al. 2021) TaxID=2038776 RepID=A0A7M2YC55_9FLAO|nr:efflux transporter outer membrane subunit [Kaistella flava (ex Peng et al. 2021)]QOW11848.1 efflux transporter outer membrane subunit [Kaistella flava (ex Peng et al. 2021)]
MKNNIFKIVGIILTTALCITNCGISKTYQAPTMEMSELYRDAETTDTTTIANLPYTTLFKDQKLQKLIAEGIANSYDLKVAVARIKQAEANFDQSKLQFLPNVSALAQVTQQGLSATQSRGFTANKQIFQLGGNASWEADIWGKLQSAKRGELALLLQSQAYQRTVQSLLIAHIANNYYNLLAMDKELEITLKTISYLKEDISTNKLLKTANRITEASVAQSEANLYATQVTIPDLKYSIRQTENALSILIARSPGPIDRGTIEEQEFDTVLQTGIPAQLLANRPDVQQAEYQLRYNFEHINNARTYFYPSLTITAQGGWQNTTLKTLFDPASLFYNLIGGLAQPIFNQGLNKQILAIAKAQYEENTANFYSTLLGAGQEVSNALFSYQMAEEKKNSRDEQLLALSKAVDYNRELLNYGYAQTSYLDVLTSQQSYLAAQLNQVSDQLQKLTAVVNLYQSLGGGWK